VTTRKFPASGFLLLGILSILASVVFIVRAAGVEATTERIWSALAFAAMGILWLVVYWSAQRSASR